MRPSRMMKHLGVAWLLALAVLLAACGQSPSPGFVPWLGDELAVTQGDSVSTRLTLTPLNGFSGSVQLALTVRDSQGKVVKGIALSPDHVTLGAKPAAQTLTLKAAADAPAGSYNATLRASSGKLSKAVPFTLKVQTAPLTFIFKGIPDGASNPPTVTVEDSHGKTVTTENANGRFTLPELTPGTYTLHAPDFTDEGDHYTATYDPHAAAHVGEGETATLTATYAPTSTSPPVTQTGSLELTVSGIPDSASPTITVKDSSGKIVATENANGTFTISNLDQETYTLSAPNFMDSSGYAYTASLDPSDGEVQVSAGDAAEASVTYAAQTGSLKLTIHGILGFASNPPTVTVTDSSGNTVTTENTDGKVTLPNLAPGTYTLAAPNFVDNDGYGYIVTLGPAPRCKLWRAKPLRRARPMGRASPI